MFVNCILRLPEKSDLWFALLIINLEEIKYLSDISDKCLPVLRIDLSYCLKFNNITAAVWFYVVETEHNVIPWNQQY